VGSRPPLFAEEPIEHEREELGVNPMPRHPCGDFQQLDDLKPPRSTN
jgi:hypothetical protein